MSPTLEEAVMTGPRERWQPLHEFAYIDRAFRDVRRLLADRPGEVVPDSATAHLGGLDLIRHVRMVMGELQIGHRTAWLTIHWEDLRHPGLFPFLDATLEFMPVAAGNRPTTQVALRGRYRPPLGGLGSLADSLVGHRVVEQSVRVFIEELARHLEAALPANVS
jgi:hypothetical protein